MPAKYGLGTDTPKSGLRWLYLPFMLLLGIGSLALATQRWKAEGVRWRLPRVNELKRLLDRSSKPQGLNPELFPNAPRDWHWTGTAAVNAQRLNSYNYAQVDKSSSLSGLSAQQAWAVNTETLQAVPDMGKGNALLLRLVRPATEAELGSQTSSAP